MEKNSAQVRDSRMDSISDQYGSTTPQSRTLKRPDSDIFQIYSNFAMSKWLYWLGLANYVSSFMVPYWSAAKYFVEMEKRGPDGQPPWETVRDFIDLVSFDLELAARGTMSGFTAMSRYHGRELGEVSKLLLSGKVDDLLGFSQRQLKLMEMAVDVYPRAIKEIEPEYGFHFEGGGYEKVAETNRFFLYRVLPIKGHSETRDHGKPTLIIPPYVLGANILALLPGENRSFVHAFANKGVPTYIRVVKSIDTTPAVQLMTGEDDARDTGYFARKIVERHGKPLTLTGYCQGGFIGVIDFLSGELDGLVDALITSVAPMDGSRSKSLVEYIEHLPHRFRDLGYSLKTLPNGNKVVDGKVMGWIFKLKSLEKEAPLLSFYRDLAMFEDSGSNTDRSVFKISKVAAAISHWLTYDRTDLPLEITRLSFDSYTVRVSADGTLPVRLFGRPLNFNRIREKKIKWHISIAEKDDLIDKEAALAPLDFVDAEVAVFPKGHAAIATTWSEPASKCSLELDFNKSGCGDGESRGPVRFHLDLDEEYSNGN